jgi:hypothetical protein
MKQLLVILFLSFTLNVIGQTLPDSTFTDKSLAKAGLPFNGKPVTHFDSLKLTYCRCDSLPDWGWSLYDSAKRIHKCGHFVNGKLLCGLKFIYSDKGILVDIEKYYNGQKVGNCKSEASKLKQ